MKFLLLGTLKRSNLDGQSAYQNQHSTDMSHATYIIAPKEHGAHFLQV